MSRRPKRPVTSPTSCSTAAPSVISQAKAAALIWCREVSSRATPSASSRLCAYMTAICTPSFASAWQMRCPSPPLPPVTRATAPLRSMSFLPHTGARLSRSASPCPRTVCYLTQGAGKPLTERSKENGSFGSGADISVLPREHRLTPPSPRVTGTPGSCGTNVPAQLLEEKMPGNAPSYLKPGALDRILGSTLVLLVRIGLIRGHFYVLEVRGRKSGRTISLPVDPLDLEGQRYLVCARGNSNWVRNARTAGEVALVRAMRRRRYAARELPPSLRPPVLKAYLD